MTDKNITLKDPDNDDSLFPKTKDSQVILPDGTLDTKLAAIATILNTLPIDYMKRRGIVPSYNLNSATSAGMYTINTSDPISNGPPRITSWAGGTLLVFSMDENNLIQIIMSLSQFGIMWSRLRRNATWLPWVPIQTSGTPFINVTGNITLGLMHVGQKLWTTGTTTITIPTNILIDWPIGTEIEIVKGDNSVVTIDTVSISAYCKTAVRTIKSQYDSVYLKNITMNQWLIQGELG